MKKSKRVTSLIVYCKKCKHNHVAVTGPCTKMGCGCHALSDADQPERDKVVKEFIKKKYGKHDKEKRK